MRHLNIVTMWLSLLWSFCTIFTDASSTSILKRSSQHFCHHVNYNWSTDETKRLGTLGSLRASLARSPGLFSSSCAAAFRVSAKLVRASILQAAGAMPLWIMGCTFTGATVGSLGSGRLVTVWLLRGECTGIHDSGSLSAPVWKGGNGQN